VLEGDEDNANDGTAKVRENGVNSAVRTFSARWRWSLTALVTTSTTAETAAYRAFVW
jgi:hypothetical protein